MNGPAGRGEEEPPHASRPPDAVAKGTAMAAMADKGPAAASEPSESSSSSDEADAAPAAAPEPLVPPCSSGEWPGLPRVAAAAGRGGESAAGLGRRLPGAAEGLGP